MHILSINDCACNPHSAPGMRNTHSAHDAHNVHGSSLYDVIVVGAGAAGMAAAHSAAMSGARIALIERDAHPGGILPQCIHDGFGVFSKGESLTGPAYAQDLWEMLDKCDVDVFLSCDVHSLSVEPCMPSGDLGVRANIRGSGAAHEKDLLAQQIVLATGCYERSGASLGIVGTRPAGVICAGAAQHLMNIDDVLPGENVVILGAGDIGAIVARRLIIRGAKVAAVIGADVTCLHRNYVQCMRDLNVPVRVPWTVLAVEGARRVEALRIAPLDKSGLPIMSQEEKIACDTLLLAAGLIPRTELLDAAQSSSGDINLSDFIHFAGNARSIHALVDAAVVEGARVGKKAAQLAFEAKNKHTEAAPSENNSPTSATSKENDVKASLIKDDLALLEIPEHSLPRGIMPSTESCADTYTCGLCPRSCKISRTAQADGTFSYVGFACEKGHLQALERLGTATPLQTFTGTVSLLDDNTNQSAPARVTSLPASAHDTTQCTSTRVTSLPVHSSTPLSVEQIAKVAQIVRSAQVKGTFKRNEVVISHEMGLPCDLLASCDSSFAQRL